MNSDALARLYDQLDPFERLPLMIAAGVRGDKTEQRRLSEAAPHMNRWLPNYYPLARALDQTVHYHLLNLLDLAAKFWQWWAMDAVELLLEDTSASGHSEQERSEESCRYFASRFIAYFDGWKQFCAELHIDPEARMNFMIGWSTIVRTEEIARAQAFTPEEAEPFLHAATMPGPEKPSLERGTVPVESPETIAADWHIVLDKFLVREGGTRTTQYAG
jgi:hypothetical protein